MILPSNSLPGLPQAVHDHKLGDASSFKTLYGAGQMGCQMGFMI